MFIEKKIGTVIKHIPGHGKAKTDSHKFLPIVKQIKGLYLKMILTVFQKQKSLYAMTAHILYKKIDKQNCQLFHKKL